MPKPLSLRNKVQSDSQSVSQSLSLCRSLEFIVSFHLLLLLIVVLLQLSAFFFFTSTLCDFFRKRFLYFFRVFYIFLKLFPFVMQSGTMNEFVPEEGGGVK